MRWAGCIVARIAEVSRVLDVGVLHLFIMYVRTSINADMWADAGQMYSPFNSSCSAIQVERGLTCGQTPGGEGDPADVRELTSYLIIQILHSCVAMTAGCSKQPAA